MKKLKKRQAFLVSVFLILVIYYISDSGLFANLGSVDVLRENTTGRSKTESGGENNIQKYVQAAATKELNWDGAWDNDPFFYVSHDTLEGSEKLGLINQLFGRSDALPVSGFSLTGISWLGNSGFALINESVVKEGDVIGGFSVDRVAFNYVLLKQGSQTIRLPLD